MSKIIWCPFCRKEVGPIDSRAWMQIFTCSGCGARYWLETAENLWEVPEEAEEILGIPSNKIEQKIIRDFDVFLDYPDQPKEYGEEICVVFVKKKED